MQQRNINKDCRVLFDDIFIVPSLGPTLGYLTTMFCPGWEHLVAFDWNDLPVGRKCDCNFLKNVKSPPHALPPPPPPAGFWLIGALLFHLKVMNYSAVYCHMTTCGIFFFWHAQEVKGCDFSWKKKSQNFAWLVQRKICLIFKQLIMTKLTMKIILKEGKGIQINFKHCIIKHNQ